MKRNHRQNVPTRLSTRRLLATATACGALSLASVSTPVQAQADGAQNQQKQGQPARAKGAQPIEDTAIQIGIQSEYAAENAPWFNDVGVRVADGTATLDGRVRNLRQKEVAERLATTVRGVEQVRNEIKIERSQAISASELTDRVNRALLINTATESFEIDVEATDRGQVTLSGEVDSYAERWLARDVTAGVHGVIAVINNIAVDYDTDRIASEVRQDIVSSLKMDALIDASEIEVRIDDDTANLSGQVRSLAERDRAVASAYVAGVAEVDANALTVNPSQTPFSDVLSLTDDDIETAIQTNLILDPRVDHEGVVATLYNGRATLTGTVDTLSAKRSAERIARETAGVRRVSNFLRVSPEQQPADKQIQRQITQALANNSVVEGYEIDAQVNDGIVRLQGQVDSHLEKWETSDVVASIKGVREVNNRIDVDDTATWVYYDPYTYPGLMPGEMDRPQEQTVTPTDRELREDIESELFWSPFVDSDDVDVHVDAGVVTLTGTVEDYSELRDATTNAFEGGALVVDNDLTVETK
ncbi:MAG: BON domain-containing protein [Phycisphaeraceae bacterium]